jgi:hypothetical protein
MPLCPYLHVILRAVQVFEKFTAVLNNLQDDTEEEEVSYYENTDEAKEDQDEKFDDSMKTEIIKETQVAFAARVGEADPSTREEEQWMEEEEEGQQSVHHKQVAHRIRPIAVNSDLQAAPNAVQGGPQATRAATQGGSVAAQDGPKVAQDSPQSPSFLAESGTQATTPPADYKSLTSAAAADGGSRAGESAADGGPALAPGDATASARPQVYLSATGEDRKTMNNLERVEREGIHFRKNRGASVQPLMASILLLCLVLNRLM